MAKKQTRIGLVKKQAKTIHEQRKEIARLKTSISKMSQALAKTSRKTLAAGVQQTNKEVKKEHKFNVKAWLATSCFAIGSLLVGIANMVIHFVDK